MAAARGAQLERLREELHRVRASQVQDGGGAAAHPVPGERAEPHLVITGASAAALAPGLDGAAVALLEAGAEDVGEGEGEGRGVRGESRRQGKEGERGSEESIEQGSF